MQRHSLAELLDTPQSLRAERRCGELLKQAKDNGTRRVAKESDLKKRQTTERFLLLEIRNRVQILSKSTLPKLSIMS